METNLGTFSAPNVFFTTRHTLTQKQLDALCKGAGQAISAGVDLETIRLFSKSSNRAMLEQYASS